MMTLNLLWPKWADVVAHLHWKTIQARGSRSVKAVHRAAALLANGYGREQDARFARLAWERFHESRLRELWARPVWNYKTQDFDVRPRRWSVRYARNLVLILALSFLSPSLVGADEMEKPGRLYGALGWATFAGSTGDLASTEYALSDGASELNPLLQNRGVRIASAAAFPFAANRLTEELRKDGHPKLALWCRIAVVALKGYVVVHNLRAAR